MSKKILNKVSESRHHDNAWAVIKSVSKIIKKLKSPVNDLDVETDWERVLKHRKRLVEIIFSKLSTVSTKSDCKYHDYGREGESIRRCVSLKMLEDINYLVSQELLKSNELSNVNNSYYLNNEKSVRNSTSSSSLLILNESLKNEVTELYNNQQSTDKTIKNTSINETDKRDSEYICWTCFKMISLASDPKIEQQRLESRRSPGSLPSTNRDFAEKVWRYDPRYNSNVLCIIDDPETKGSLSSSMSDNYEDDSSQESSEEK
uniref:Protein 4 n=1 Tax=Linum virus 1 TaxID=2977971 RepID=A0A9N6YJB2_9RHAB|nr:TPA_asm: protein 4 [Linum virus 1]